MAVIVGLAGGHSRCGRRALRVPNRSAMVARTSSPSSRSAGPATAASSSPNQERTSSPIRSKKPRSSRSIVVAASTLELAVTSRLRAVRALRLEFRWSSRQRRSGRNGHSHSMPPSWEQAGGPAGRSSREERTSGGRPFRAARTAAFDEPKPLAAGHCMGERRRYVGRLARRGAVAQMGERCNRTAEVRGSIPLSSTTGFRQVSKDLEMRGAGRLPTGPYW